MRRCSACRLHVRGAGLHIDVEVLKDRKAKTPDAATAAAIVNQLRKQRVLISATVFNANVLKIRPPLVFSNSDATRLLDEVREAVRAVAE